MSLSLRESDDFAADFERGYRWYFLQASEAVARRFLKAVWETLELLADRPRLGRVRKFRHPKLRELRSFKVEAPFGSHLIFYRQSQTELFAERLMHGARDLPRRLREPPGIGI